MSKQLKIIEHKFNNNGIKRVSKQARNKKIEQLHFKVKDLEEMLNRIISLVNALNHFEEESKLSSDNESSITYDKYKMLRIKQYLKWVLAKIKDSRGLIQNNTEDEAQFLGNSFINNLNYMEKTLLNNFTCNTVSPFSLRNRAGRSAEHVGNNPNMFDYGTFLEKFLSYHDCFVYGSGFHFHPSEIIHYVKQTNPGFLSKAIVASLNLHWISIPGYNFKEIFDNNLSNIVTLLPQTCHNISIENLKALTMLYDMSLIQSNFSLSHQLLCMAIRMSHLLGIDKIQLDSEIKTKPFNEYKQLVELKKLWFWLSISVSLGDILNELPPLTNCNIVSSSELDHFNNYETSVMINSVISHNSCKNVFIFISNQTTSVLSLILGHLQSNFGNQNDLSQAPYSKICLPNNKYDQAQAFFDKYKIISHSFISDEFRRQSKNESILIEKYLCRFPSNYTCKFKMVHETRKSLSIYLYQIFLIFPVVLRTPRQVNIPLSRLLIMLDVSLKMLLIYRAIAYVYFETLLTQIVPRVNEENNIYEDISNYLASRPRPLVKEKTEYYFYMMRVYNFREPLYAFCALLQILSSQGYYNSGLASNESIAIIKTNITELFEIYKLGYKLKDDLARMDIDFTIEKLKQIIHRFHILPEYQIDWVILLKDFEIKL